jgi:hypothetical protein
LTLCEFIRHRCSFTLAGAVTVDVEVLDGRCGSNQMYITQRTTSLPGVPPPNTHLSVRAVHRLCRMLRAYSTQPQIRAADICLRRWRLRDQRDCPGGPLGPRSSLQISELLALETTSCPQQQQHNTEVEENELCQCSETMSILRVFEPKYLQ